MANLSNLTKLAQAIMPVTHALPEYAELFCLSNFTFLHGASHAEELVERAKELGYGALAITDECSLAGVVRAHAVAKRHGLPLIIGTHVRVQASPGAPATSLLLLAQNRNGYGNLSELITLARTRAEKGHYHLCCADFAEAAPVHLRALPDCVVILLPDYPAQGQVLTEQAAWVARTFPKRAWLGLTLLHRVYDDLHRARVEEVGWEQVLPLVALGQVCMHVRSRKPLQDMLSSIRLCMPIAECGYALAQNAEQHLRSRLRLANLYPAHALAATMQIARSCQFSLDQLRYEYPNELVPPGFTATSYLRQESWIGAQRRFPHGIPASVQQQIEHELALIADLRYEPYFLTVYDIVRFARRQQILCQGRGSAANSAVCYCLGITEVDPARGNLLFERFISKERAEAPDIDVDFEHQRREEVIQYIYQKYGRDRAALAAAVTTYRPRSALRDSGKALGVDPLIIDKIAKGQHWFDSQESLLANFAAAGLNPDSELAQRWAKLARQLLGFPRHLSQHTGGFVIAADKLSRLVPVENASMADRSVIEWDKDDLEELGLLKIDILALGMLSALRRTLELVSQQRGERFELHDIPPEDPATWDMLCQADTVGVFQIESRAQMAMLPRLQPRCFYDLVIEVSLVRPGPLQGGMVHPYLRRRQGLEPVSFPSVQMEQALARTLGVPIFQEQVMQVAMLAAGFSAGEADQLRRAMAAWKRKGGLDQYRERIISGMLERGYEAEFAEAICSQIQGFGEYGFPESHAASFALLVYASAWLKRHHPAAFVCALLNSQPMGFYSPGQLVQDARRHGVEVRAVDVQISGWESRLEPPHAQADTKAQSGAYEQVHTQAGTRAQAGTHTQAQAGARTSAGAPLRAGAGSGGPALRLGLSRLSGMRREVAQRIEEARAIRPFTDLADLARRTDLDRHDLQVLAAGNALQSLVGNRRQALWQAVAAVAGKDLLRTTEVPEGAPALPRASEGEELISDYRALGLTLGRHPLALLRKQLHAQRLMSAELLGQFQDGQLARACGMVVGRQRPGTAKGVLFLTLEDETGNVNVIVWPKLVEQQRKEAFGAGLLAVYGVWQRQGGVQHLIAKRLVDLTHLLGRLGAVPSRDFH
jgi:error-prone DNA polymerase